MCLLCTINLKPLGVSKQSVASAALLLRGKMISCFVNCRDSDTCILMADFGCPCVLTNAKWIIAECFNTCITVRLRMLNFRDRNRQIYLNQCIAAWLSIYVCIHPWHAVYLSHIFWNAHIWWQCYHKWSCLTFFSQTPFLKHKISLCKKSNPVSVILFYIFMKHLKWVLWSWRECMRLSYERLYLTLPSQLHLASILSRSPLLFWITLDITWLWLWV